MYGEAGDKGGEGGDTRTRERMMQDGEWVVVAGAGGGGGRATRDGTGWRR